MEKDAIKTLRKKLDELIERGADYEKIYEVSQNLDKRIIEYYRTNGLG